jgi:ABC-type multidrug transport system fused ATPase/permease subunit
MFRTQPQYRQRQAGMPPGGRQIVLPEPAQVGQLVVRGVTAFARRNKVISGSYVLGILVILLIGSGTKLNYEQRREYNNIMNTIDIQAEYDASSDYWRANEAYVATKGWFTCDGLCQRNKARMEDAKYRLDIIRKEGEARMSDAKSVAGLFSEVGVGEVQDSFWSYFSKGKQFAKRQSMWDAMFMGFSSMRRDENMVEYGLKVLMQVLMNFSIGLVMALVMFVIGLWTIVRSYQPNPIVAVLFFVMAACAAFSFVATYLLAIYGAAAGGVYGVLKLAESNVNARLQEGQRQQQPYMHNQPHHE